MTPEDLLERASAALDAAYAPYSEYRVGAALESSDGTVFSGCNVENANFSNSLHAEEVAVGEAVREGHDDFAALAVVSDRRDGVTPCGMCRQTLTEFGDPSMPIHCDEDGEVVTYTLGELLPAAMDRDTLQ